MPRANKDKSPAFQWYSKDILSSTRVAMMTLEEEGAYRRAIDFCWLNGSLPNDPEKLARIIGKGCSTQIAELVKTMFIVDKKDPSKILHERLEKERTKQRNFANKKSLAGIASGISRRKKSKLKREQMLNSVHVLFEQNDPKTRTKTNSSSSSSSPMIDDDNEDKSSSSSSAGPKKNGHRSEFSLAECQDYARFLLEIGRPLNNPEGFAISIYQSGEKDEELKYWIESGKKDALGSIKQIGSRNKYSKLG